MKVSRRTVGSFTDPDDGSRHPVEALRAEAEGRLVVEVWTYGATLVEAQTPDRSGRLANVCLTLPDLEAYVDPARNPYIGCVMGRFARCVRNGRLQIDGRLWQLDRNMGPHHFHGGSRGFDRFVWDAEVESSPAHVDLVLRLKRPDGDQGYPGAVEVETRYRVSGDGDLAIEHRAVADAPTIVGLTSHAFWNLAGTGRIDEHRLAVNASRFIAADEAFMPLPGPPRRVDDSPCDLRFPETIGARTLDLCYALDDPGWAARLEHPASGRTMTIETDQPGLAVYSGDHLPARRTGLCLQTGAWPDAPNRPDFPSPRLEAGETYVHYTRYGFSAV
ncbi:MULTISPECIES: aldose epimerase family protein [unclassified Phenylobacterium]|uniref:aldose epimerase family protein n=1 Tax=unclassified Phenylobacterium TaxID=2640670 RepID=UPI00083AF721|nr:MULTISPECIES: aldose epimerase family protein [unclassified Phenylobacterium]